MSELKDLVPGLDLCRKIPSGKFKDSALVWDYKIGRWTNQYRVRKRELFDTPVCPAPLANEILEELQEDMSSLEYRDSSPHWVVHSTLTDETPAGATRRRHCCDTGWNGTGWIIRRGRTIQTCRTGQKKREMSEEGRFCACYLHRCFLPEGFDYECINRICFLFLLRPLQSKRECCFPS